MVDTPNPVQAFPQVQDSAWRVRLRRGWELVSGVLANPTTLVGLVIVTAMIAMALLAPVITVPNTPDAYQMPRDWTAARAFRPARPDIFSAPPIAAATCSMGLSGAPGRLFAFRLWSLALQW